ncbi:AtpZ/AtpI family protein [Oceanivirga miroungae]|uniref:Uncharacterized protein n=1 Tax=Oceanivirga miroungae TaxID=1130046 RepID=A0A6I8MAP2_9FUSO|nr:AtpZ/AtpI family protein [Oceanivirga miroungae]VWL85243.1 hypothetical protein OMES3154_00526 [Oceanivirga miroungae]
MKKNDNMLKYFVISTNYIFTLASPVVLMIVLYYVFSKYVFHKENDFILVIMIILGIVSGYVSLYKEIKGK